MSHPARSSGQAKLLLRQRADLQAAVEAPATSSPGQASLGLRAQPNRKECWP